MYYNKFNLWELPAYIIKVALKLTHIKKIIKDNKRQTYRHYEADYGTRTALSEAKRPSDCELRGSSLDAWLIAPLYYRSWNQLFGINLINYFNDYKNKKNWLLNFRFWNDSHQMWETTTACVFACLLGAVKIFKIIASTESYSGSKEDIFTEGQWLCAYNHVS